VKDDQVVQKTMTDDFGDFKFDGLLPGSGSYRIHIGETEPEKKSIEVSLNQGSVSMETIFF